MKWLSLGAKKRRLHGALGEPVGRELGAVGNYNEQAFESLEEDELLEKEDKEWQVEIQDNIEFANIFELIANSKEEALRLKEESDGLIQKRVFNNPRMERLMLPRRHKKSAKDIFDHIRSNQNVDDEVSLLLAIDKALLADYVASSY